MLTRLTFTLWYATIVLQAGLILRLAGLRLLRRYLPVALWALCDCASALILVQFDYDPEVYLPWYVAGQSIVILAEFFAIGGIFSAHLEAYPGIGSFGRKLLLGLVALSALISVVVIRFDWEKAENSVAVVLAASRIISSAFAVFLLSAALFFARYRVPTRRNVLTLERGATGLFVIQSGAFLALLTIGARANEAASLAIQAGICTLFLYWNVAMRKLGELFPERPDYNPEEHARVEALNRDALKWSKAAQHALWRNWRK